MAKTYREKIAAAKAAPKSLKKNKTVDVVEHKALSKANKLIVRQAKKAKATNRNTGATEGISFAAGDRGRNTAIPYDYEVGLKKAINAAIKQGRPQDVQRIRASQAVDVSKTAMRAKIVEMNARNTDSSAVARRLIAKKKKKK